MVTRHCLLFLESGPIAKSPEPILDEETPSGTLPLPPAPVSDMLSSPQLGQAVEQQSAKAALNSTTLGRKIVLATPSVRKIAKENDVRIYFHIPVYTQSLKIPDPNYSWVPQ